MCEGHQQEDCNAAQGLHCDQSVDLGMWACKSKDTQATAENTLALANSDPGRPIKAGTAAQGQQLCVATKLLLEANAQMISIVLW